MLFIILPRKRVAAVEEMLDKHAASDWRENGSIFLIAIADQYVNSKRHILATVRSHSKKIGLREKQTNLRYLVFCELDFSAKDAEPWLLTSNFFNDLSSKTLASGLLKIQLKEWGLYWKQIVVGNIGKWQHDDIKERDVDEWLKQFDKISGDNKRWVGERLLRNFLVWSSEKIAHALHRDVEDDDSQTCIIRYENGKSADAISVILRKKLPHLIGDADILEYRAFLERYDGADCHVYEDGLFTGVEMSDLLRSLQGIDGFNKCAPLADPFG